GLKWAGKGSFEEGYLLGMLIGDGTLKKDGAVISVWGRDEEAQSLVNAATGCAAALPHRSDFTGFQKMIEAREEQRMKMAALRDVAAGYGITPGNKVITAEIEKTGYDFHRGFLRGIFDTDGTVIGNHEKGVSVRLWQKDMSSMVSVQRMLQRLGIASVIYGNRKNSGVSNLPDGKGGSKSYNVSAGHELVISGDNIAFYHEVVGFASSKKQVRLNQVLNKYKRAINRERYTACVTAVKEATTCDVYDVQIPGKNAFDANGIYVHNCGEQPLLPYEACNLGSINLDLMLKEENGTVEVDYEKLKQTVRKAVHFLDNVIEVNKYPLPEIDKMTKGTRKIGLGVMAWADMLCKLGIPYNSQAAVDLAENVMGFIQDESHKMSTEMAKKKGVFPYFDQSVFKGKGISFRNATTTTIAPTGTLSIIAGVSSGIEPIFAISYIRNVMDNDELVEVNSLFKKIAVEGGFYSDDLMKRIAKKGSIKGFDEIPQKWQKIFATSHDISPEWHVKMQSAFQKYTDNAVSKTVNLCHDATKDDVRDVFLLAFRTGCKGVTIYRDGSRDMQVLNIGKVKGKEGGSKESAGTVGHTATGESGKIIAGDAIDSSGKASMAEAAAAAGNYHPNVVNGRIIPRSRPDITTGFTEKVKIGCGNLYITVNCDENGICEVFTNTGRAGGCPSQSEATSRLVSIALRSGMDAKSIVEQLKGIRCPSTTRQKDLKVLSCPDAIGRLIEKVMKLQTGKENGKDGLNGNGHDNIGHLSTLNGHGTTGHSSSVNSSSSTIPSSSPSSGFSSNSSSGYSSGTGTGSGSGSGAGSVGLAGNIGSSSSGSGLIVGSRSNIGSNGSSGSCSDGGSGSNGSSNSNGGNGSNAIIGSSCSSISSGYGNINGSAAFSGNVAAGVTSANVRTANINPIGYVKKEVNYPRPTAKCLKECQECSMRDFCNNPDRDADMVEETEMDEIFSEVIASESSSKGETVYDLLNLLKDCPDCGSKLEHEGGCVICRNCGFSKCG
ncbi:MAG: LAGLIDADG family homing endonuclease, partial [Clostridiales bacterium]|nr:LAGLIDADG family homing endonuclease [Clostridiales bacterium]